MEKLRYQEISDDLESKIRRRELTGRLPGIIKLTEDYSAGQSTVKRAVKQLIDKGLLTLDGTRGTFISGSMPEGRRNGVIGLVGSFFSERENARLLEELNGFSASFGYTVVQIADLMPLVRNRPQALAEMPCDGFMVFGLTGELAAAIRSHGKAVVALNACHDISGVSWADFDWEPAIESVLRMFAGEGHRRIGFAMWDNRYAGFRERMFSLYRRVLEEEGVFDPSLFFADIDAGALYARYGEAYLEEAGRAAADYFREQKEPPTAMYAHFKSASAAPLLSEGGWHLVYSDFSGKLAASYLKMNLPDLLQGGFRLLVDQLGKENFALGHYLSPVCYDTGKLPLKQ